MKKHTHSESAIQEATLVEAVNLRRDPKDKTVWRRAGIPREVFKLGVLPFLRFSPYGDGVEIELSTDSQNNLYGRILSNCEHDDYPLSPLPKKLAELPAEPILAITDADGIIRLMLRHSPDCFLTYDRNLYYLNYEGAMPELPEIELVARDATSFYSSIESIPLTGGSSGLAGSRLCDADAARVKAAMLAAYEDVKEQAHRFGRFVQPVTARYRLLDAAGNTLALGPKTLLECSRGSSPIEKVVFRSTDGMQSLKGGSMEALSYNPTLIVPDRLPYPWDKIVDRLVVEITTEMEPVDPSKELPYGVQRDAVAATSTVSAQLPGLSMSTEIIGMIYANLAIAQLKAPIYKAYELPAPFGGGIVFDGEQLEPGRSFPFAYTDPTFFERAVDGDTLQVRHLYSAAFNAGEFTILCNPREVGKDGCYYPGVAEVVPTADLGDVLSRRKVMDGEIAAAAALPRSGSGWDFSRLKLLMFGREGSKLVTINGKGEFHAVTTIDHRPILSASAVCGATGSNGASLLAIAGNDIIEISGQKVVTLLSGADLDSFGSEAGAPLPQLTDIGWCEKHKEIWLTDSRRTWRLTSDSELICAKLPGIENIEYQPPIRFGISRGSACTSRASLSSGALLLATSREVRNLSAEQSSGLIDITLRLRFPNPLSPASSLSASYPSAAYPSSLSADYPSASSLSVASLTPAHRSFARSASSDVPLLSLRFFGSGLMGSYRLLGDRGSEIAEELLKLVITGDVNAPIPLRLALPYRHWLEEEFRFAANADLAIRPSRLINS